MTWIIALSLRFLVRGGAKLIELRQDEIGLEEVFMRVTRGDTQ
jgi:hypothetical protein